MATRTKVTEESVRAVLYSRGRTGVRVLIVENRPYPRDGKVGFNRLPGGTVERGETDEQCLRRELREELGLRDIEGVDRKPMASYEYMRRSAGVRKGTRIYAVRVSEAVMGKLRPDMKELLGYSVTGPLQAARRLYYHMERAAMRRFCARMGIGKAKERQKAQS